MKIIKPDSISVIPRVMELHRQSFLVATALIGFVLDNPQVLPEEAQIWQAASQALGEDQTLDAGFLKPLAEVLLVGSCHAYQGRPVPASQVRLAFGQVNKTLIVTGDRFWSTGLLDSRLTQPAPFVSMPLDYAHAFGGPGNPQNPLGKGFAPLVTPEGREVHPLPNIEAPHDRAISKTDQPAPVGFGPLDPSWPQRSSRTGTFDSSWLEEVWPHFPLDMDMRYFNTAPQDQWLTGWPQGDEPFILVGVHPDRLILESRLPGKKVRAFVVRDSRSQEAFSEISLHIDTIWFFPDQNMGVIAFRGSLPVKDDEASEMLFFYAALEDLANPKLVPRHYADFMTHINPPPATADEEMPAESGPEPEVSPKSGPPPTLSPEDQATLAALNEQLQAAENKLAEEMAKLGLDYQAALKAETVSPGLPTMSLEQAESLLSKTLADLGLGVSKTPLPAGPTLEQITFEPQAIIASLGAVGLLTPDLEKDIWALDREFKTLKDEAKKISPAGEPEKKESMASAVSAAILDRETLLNQYAAGRRDFSGTDLTGIDLSGVDISGINLEGAVLVEANFSQTCLRGARLVNVDASQSAWIEADLRDANLGGANFTQADLTAVRAGGCAAGEADFSEAQAPQAGLTNANLQGAVFTSANLSGADLTRADFSRSVCTGVNLVGATLIQARLEQADFSRAKLGTADLTQVQAGGSDFSGADLSTVKMIKACLAGTSLDNAVLNGADFSYAQAPGLSLHGAIGEGVKFQAANLENLRTDTRTSLPQADFSVCCLEKSYFGGSNLTRANFTQSRLDHTTFQNCQLIGAGFHRATARESRFLKCDLTGAIMTGFNFLFGSLAKSDCTRTDFRDSNLFGVDTMKTVFQETNVLGANLHRSRLQEQVSHDQG